MLGCDDPSRPSRAVGSARGEGWRVGAVPGQTVPRRPARQLPATFSQAPRTRSADVGAHLPFGRADTPLSSAAPSARVSGRGQREDQVSVRVGLATRLAVVSQEEFQAFLPVLHWIRNLYPEYVKSSHDPTIKGRTTPLKNGQQVSLKTVFQMGDKHVKRCLTPSVVGEMQTWGPTAAGTGPGRRSWCGGLGGWGETGALALREGQRNDAFTSRNTWAAPHKVVRRGDVQRGVPLQGAQETQVIAKLTHGRPEQRCPPRPENDDAASRRRKEAVPDARGDTRERWKRPAALKMQGVR